MTLPCPARLMQLFERYSDGLALVLVFGLALIAS